MSDHALERAYADCLATARSHYENFPVASWLLPRALRRPVAVIYAFARQADDIADEGDLAPEGRLARLAGFDQLLDGIAAGTPQTTSLGLALADVVGRHRLPIGSFRDLLSAFRQDVTCTRYADFGEVMDYCRRSANPIGRLLLHLLGRTDARDLACSDAICRSAARCSSSISFRISPRTMPRTGASIFHRMKWNAAAWTSRTSVSGARIRACSA